MSHKAEEAVRVVIVGGGFGGRDAASRLAYRLPRGSRVTLVDRNSYTLYTPMLTEVAGRSVSAGHIQAPLRALSRRIECVQEEVTAADLRARTITLADGRQLAADHLVFALGSTTNFREVEGAAEHSFTMKTIEDARRVQAHSQSNVERAARTIDPEERKRLLTFAVAGGGYTGVETIAAVNDLVRDTAQRNGIASSELRVMLIEPAKRLMAEMPESLASYSEQQLVRDGIEIRIGVGVQRVTAGGMTLSTGEVVSAGLLVWDTGIEPNPLVASFDCAKGKKGGIATDSAFHVPDRPGVWAIGDCAEIPKPDGSGDFFEPTAQNATREGVHVADNILATIRGRAVKPFTYKQVGELAVISRYAGVAHVYGARIRGLLGWLMWRGIYLAKMPGLKERAGILWDWMRLMFGRHLVPAS